jgi:hypothetical protein
VQGVWCEWEGEEHVKVTGKKAKGKETTRKIRYVGG